MDWGRSCQLSAASYQLGMPESKNKPLMRSIGEFVGHLVKAVKSDPADKKIELSKTEHQEDRGNITLRRTTIEEIEIHQNHRKSDP